MTNVNSSSTSFSPREIVSELNRHIIGQEEAKKAVAIALRNRWRRQQLDPSLREEVVPKNILMIGPTGVGKTEIARRLAKLAQAPFIKVEATKFTEIGYVGRDVESIIRDLVDNSIHITKKAMHKTVHEKAERNAEERVLNALVGEHSSEETREKFRTMLRNGELADKEITIEVEEPPENPMQTFDVPGMPGASMGMFSLADLLGAKSKMKKKHMTVEESYKTLINEESDNLIDKEALIKQAILNVENNGIVFIDEFDKICGKAEGNKPDVSREGVQRDLLPLIEGTTVPTKHGPVKTDHILFIASGAFHIAKPSDLLPELQGRLPIRVELKALTKDDFYQILTEPENNLILQYTELLKTENFTLVFKDEALREIASLCAEINESVENIGARRLHTILEKLLEDISFTASDRSGETFEVTAEFVREQVGKLAQKTDLTKFIL
ncbi:MAG: ATP-dependent protease ATPase subunit HslU [Alphaproteobacteria bacterium]|nr:ATP-dependent protease ATPase subunit HslU [Alphaproteobacteria bacterium]